MTRIAQDSLATIYFRFTWKSSHAIHTDRYLADDVSFRRDILPVGIKSRMIGLGVGDSITMTLDMAEVPPYKPGKVLNMPRARFIGPEINGHDVKPRIGRFYPKHFIEQVPGTRPDSSTPFRVVETDKAGFKADLNHPMADREVEIKATVLDIRPPAESAGKLHRWPDIILSGPGMQARLPESPTDFLGNDPFRRKDETGDAEFHKEPGQGGLIDAPAMESVRRAYGRLLSDGAQVLDLMAGCRSYLPENITLGEVTGLGMNMTALESNPALTERVIHNLNEEPVLPFKDNRFDAVLCTSGVEYLTKPFEVFEDVARVLKPGGVFAIAFSNCWHESKVIEVWTELYEFERMGLVSQYITRTDQFRDVETSSERGWLVCDDMEDRFGKGLPESDPVYLVWAYKK